MPYDKNKHLRRSIRLPGYDYASPGAYFVTICVRGGECLLGEVVDGGMRSSEWGQVVSHYWERIPNHVAQVELDEWVVMPNHVHGIIVIAGRGEASPLLQPILQLTLPPGSLGAVVGNHKSVTTRRANRQRGMPRTPSWQRYYREDIIRNDASLNRIRACMQNSPAHWAEDGLYPVGASQ